MAVLERIRFQDLEGLRVGHFNLSANTSFVIYRLGDTLIDAGPRNQWRHIQRFISERAVRQLLLTHYHEDHSGSAASIARHFRVTPRTGELTGRILRHRFSTPWYRKLVWGQPEALLSRPFDDDIRINGYDPVIPIASPGHTDDQTCFFLPQRGWLFCADMYLSSRLKLLERSEDLAMLMNSLRQLIALEPELLLCPHRGPMPNGHQLLKRKLEHLQQLAIAAQTLAASGASLSRITRQLLGPEHWMSYATGFDFSKRNLIRACLTLPDEQLRSQVACSDRTDRVC